MATYTLEQNGSNCQVTLHGDLIASVIPDLQAALKQQLQPGVTELVFDLAATIMLDSSGIGLLIAAGNTLARQNGRLRVRNVSADILRLLQSMRLTSRLNVSSREA
jgi:anti-sigma B factor antagonist